MLRPERMSKVSVTGSKPVMGDVIEAIHDLNLVHLSDYDGSWEGFDNGNPIGGAEDASDKLVTVRSLENILDVGSVESGPSRIVTEDALEEELEDVRQEANELDDRRDEIADELRSVEERIDSMEPFEALGLPLHLLSGYERIDVRLGEGDADGIRSALRDAAVVREFDVVEADDVVAVFVYPEEDARENYLEDIFVGVNFTTIEIPEDAEGDPEEYAEELRHRKQRLESKLSTVEDEIEDLRLDVASFLLAAEERLTIDVQKSEAPLQFATTENAFIAEGWIPSGKVDTLRAKLAEDVGDGVAVEELERADYNQHGEPEHTEAVTDGGSHVAMEEEPPTVMENDPLSKPFEPLTRMVGIPKYSEIDPTMLIMLTFPLFFGFMIGDLGYGILYTAAGYGIYSKFESEIVQGIGAIALFAGGFTMLFGILYGEIFGMHVLGEVLFNGKPPLHKGLQAHYSYYAKTWLVLSMIAGIIHMTVGFWFGFWNDRSHGLVDAFTHNLSWWLLMIGVWGWIFSNAYIGQKRAILFTPLKKAGLLSQAQGLPADLGWALLIGVGVIGLVGVLYGEIEEYGVVIGATIGLLESPNALVNVLSYIRIAAVLLAKAGMALVVNLLFWGAYQTDGEVHFMTNIGNPHVPEGIEPMFGGLVHGGPLYLVIGVLIFVVGHLLVLVLGITSAGLQGIRLEFVEFFNKFYEGGGRLFEPFGYEREYTTED